MLFSVVLGSEGSWFCGWVLRVLCFGWWPRVLVLGGLQVILVVVLLVSLYGPFSGVA